MASLKLACVLLLCMMVAAPISNAMNCNEVSGDLGSCLKYLQGVGTVPPLQCCSGVRTLNSRAPDTKSRQQACECIKSLAVKIPGIKPSIAAGLPSKCKVNIPYKISTTTDCKSVK